MSYRNTNLGEDKIDAQLGVKLATIKMDLNDIYE